MANTLNCYCIQLKGRNDDSSLVSAETRAQAKYYHYLGLDGLFSNFGDYLKAVKSIRNVSASELRLSDQKQRDFDRVKEYRQIPFAEIGMKVRVGNMNDGYIVGANSSCNLDVLIDGVVWNVHPNSEITYYAKDGHVLCAFGR